MKKRSDISGKWTLNILPIILKKIIGPQTLTGFLWLLMHTLEHDTNGLELWFKGISDSLFIKESDVGSPVFQAVLNFLGSEFPDIEEIKLPAPSPTFDQ